MVVLLEVYDLKKCFNSEKNSICYEKLRQCHFLQLRAMLFNNSATYIPLLVYNF